MSRLCEHCKSIDFSAVETTGFKHHTSISSLLLCAKEGACDFCSLIASEKARNAEGNAKATETVGSFFPDKKKDGVNEEYEGRVVIICKNDENDGSKCLIVFEEAETKIAGKGAIGGLDVGRQQILIPVYVDEGSEISDRFPGRRLSERGDSEACLELSKKWLENCQETHRECRNSTPEMPFLPKRVLDLGTSTTTTQKLHISEPGERGEWIALSWCWGHPDLAPLKTELASLPSRVKGIEIGDLPAVFKDACFITRKLGYRYLWIDSLCIIQDSPEDWTEQAAQMGNIYKNSTLCISADASPHSRIGVFEANQGMRNAVLEKSYNVKLRFYSSISPTKEVCFVYPVPFALKEGLKDSGSLGTRAWTFQESALAGRELSWGKMEMKWFCRTKRLSEKYPWFEMRSEAVKANFKRDLAQKNSQVDAKLLWRRAVQEYTRRFITYPEDIFPAIGAVARELQEVSRTESNAELGAYYAGLWENDIHMGLLWFTVGVKTDKPVKKSHAPSWSWATAVQSKDLLYLQSVEFPRMRYGEVFTPVAKITALRNSEGAQKAFPMGDEFGENQQVGKLRISASFLPIGPGVDVGDIKFQLLIPTEDLAAGKVGCIKISYSEWTETKLKDSLLELVDMAAKQEKLDNTTPKELGDLVTKQEMCQAWCLLVNRTSENVHEYRKVGLCLIDNKLTERWETAEILLV